MKYVQRSIPSPNSIYPFNVSDFSGGFNNRDSYTELESTHSPAMLNVDLFKEVGAVQSRGGSEVALVGVDEVENFYIKNNVFYTFDENKKFKVGASVIRTMDATPELTDFNNFLVMVDGKDVVYYGVFPQVTSTHIIVVGTPVATPTTLRLIPTTVGYTPLGATFVTGVTVYNYTNGTVEYQPCLNEVNDEYKGVSFPIFDSKVIMNRVDRIYMSGGASAPYVVAISDVDNPFYFPVALQLGLEPNGDEVVGLFNFHDVTIVGRKNDIHAIYGNTNRTDLDTSLYRVKRVNTHTGFMNRKSYCMVNNYMFYLGRDGNVYAMITPQTDINQLVTTQINKLVDLRGRGINATEEQLQSACVAYDGNYFWLAIGEYVLIYSYLNQAWQVWSFGSKINRIIYHENNIYFTVEEGGIVKYNFEESVDYGDKIVIQYYHTRQHDMNYRSRQKVWKSINVVTYFYEEVTSYVNMAIYVDFVPLEGVFDIISSAPRWGDAVFGESIFSESEIANSTPILVNGRGRLINFVFGNSTLGQRFKLFEVNGEYELRGFR